MTLGREEKRREEKRREEKGIGKFMTSQAPDLGSIPGPE
jgi:hypothetical protein